MMLSSINTMKNILLVVFGLISLSLPIIYAQSSLVASSGVASNGILRVCPSTTVDLVCSHNSVQSTRWEVSFSGFGTRQCSLSSNSRTAQLCGLYTVSNRVSSGQLVSTLEIPVTQSIDGATITCISGGSSSDPQVGSYTLQIITLEFPSTPIISNMEYSINDATTGLVSFEANSTGTLGAEISYSGSVIGGGGSVQVDDNRFTVTGLSYTESHTVNVVASSPSDACPGLLNSNVGVAINFNIMRPVLTPTTAFIDCTKPSLPISGSWTLGTDSLTPPLISTPLITYTTAQGRSGSAELESGPNPLYQLANTIQNDVYTFNVTVTNAAGSTSEISNTVAVIPFSVDESTLASRNCLTFSLGPNCASVESLANFIVELKHESGDCQNLMPSDFIDSTFPLNSLSTCVPVSSPNNVCYQASLVYDGTVIDTLTNLNFDSCSVSDLESLLTDDVMYTLNGEISNSTVSHLTTATLNCLPFTTELSGLPQITCINGGWQSAELRSCTSAVWLIVVASGLGLLVHIVLLFVVCANVYYCVKRKRLLTRQVDPNPMQQQQELEHTYEELHYERMGSNMHDNQAYGQPGQVYQLSEDMYDIDNRTHGQIYQWREDWVEDIVPHPQTHLNVAYGIYTDSP